MAYITRTELQNRLPDEGIGLTNEQLDSFIQEAIDRAEAENSVETAYSRAGVARAAVADALEVMLARDATIEAPLVEAMRKQAEAYYELHNKAGAAAGEPEAASVEESVWNTLPPLWSATSMTPYAHPWRSSWDSVWGIWGPNNW